MGSIRLIWNELSNSKKNRLIDIMADQGADERSIHREVSFKWWLYGQVDFSKTREGFDYWCGFINRHIDRCEKKCLRIMIIHNISSRHQCSREDSAYKSLRRKSMLNLKTNQNEV